MDLTKIERIDLLIRTNSTGRPFVLASKLGISKRTLYNYINFMRDRYGAPIIFSAEKQSYVYLEPGEFKIGWYKKTKN